MCGVDEGPVDVAPVIAALLAEADRLEALALVLPDFHDQAEALARAARVRADAAILALSLSDDHDHQTT